MLYLFILSVYAAALALGCAIVAWLHLKRRLPRTRALLAWAMLGSLPGFFLANALFLAVWMLFVRTAGGVDRALPPQPLGTYFFAALAGGLIFMVGAIAVSITGAAAGAAAAVYYFVRRRSPR